MSSAQTPIRIVIADDHPLVREGLRRLFELQPGFTVVGEAADGVEAVWQAKQLKPDVLLLDLTMPRLNGLEVLRELGETVDEVRTVLLTAAIEREETVQALRLGARGVVLKESATQLLYKCIRAVMNDEYWVGHERIDDLLRTLRELERAPSAPEPPASRLTRRELEVVGAIIDGATNKDIGKSFGLSEQTVKNHLSNIFDKLGVSNRLELALYAVHHRLLTKAPPVGDPAAVPQRPRRRSPSKRPT
jgi:two-component system, NarL family, nitrate/nitrite response regulator NarL